MRTLYYAPTIHSPEEFGSLAKPLLEIEKQVHGPDAEKIYREKVNQYWTTIAKCLEETGLMNASEKIHIYVDGLTAQPFYCKTCFDKTGEKRYMDEIASNKIRCSFCGRVVEADVEGFLLKLVKALIEQRLPQYLIIEKLMEKGAVIHGTESHPLLTEEHNMWTNAAKGITLDQKRAAELLQERDEFIAQRINETLPDNSKGILFIGAEHRVIQELDKLEEAGKLIFPIKVISFSGKNLF